MFITFEGIEGSGKSTTIKRLTDYFQSQGKEVLLTLEPGGSRLGRELRKILLNVTNTDLTSESELFLYLADRAQHVQQVVRPALEDGVVVLCDRFADSTVVYQGYGRGLDPKILHTLNEVAVAGTWPDATLLFDLDVEVGLKRAFSRNVADGKVASEGRFEAESVAFHTRVREGYLTWAALNKERFHVVKAELGVDEVYSQVLEIVEGLE